MSREKKLHHLGGIGNAFSDRNFCFYSIGAIATWIGYFVQLLAVSWYAWDLTHSTKWLAIIALLDIAPNVLLMPIAGAIADRFDKYWLMGIVSFLAFIQAIAIALLSWTNQLTLFPLATLTLIHGVIISFMVPAMYGILPRFVKRSCLTSAIAVSSAYAQLAVFLGPAIAGWVIVTYSVTIAFAINAVGYLVYLISWMFLKTPAEFKKPEKSNQTVLRDVLTGFQYIRKHKGLSSILVLLFAGDSLGAAVFYMAPAFSDQILGLGVVMLFGFLIFVLSVFAIFLFESVYYVIPAFIVMGIAAETYGTTMISLVQLSVTEEQRGRVMGTLFMIAQLAAGLGTYIVGYYAVSNGIIIPTLSVAGLCLLVWITYFVSSK